MDKQWISIGMEIGEMVEEAIDGNPDLFYGIADLSGALSADFNGYHYAIVLGRKLDNRIIDGIKDGPNLTYWHHYNEVNDQLFRVQAKLSASLNTNNIASRIIQSTFTDEYIDANFNDTLRFEFSHKMAATQAGLGWIGKTALFISREYGPRVRLATILTNTPLESSRTPFLHSECGECTLCVEKCPAGAATGQLWHTKLDRDEFFNPFKCRAMCRKLGHKMIGENKRLCGICVSVCPVGR